MLGEKDLIKLQYIEARIKRLRSRGLQNERLVNKWERKRRKMLNR